jgi:predicted helicase
VSRGDPAAWLYFYETFLDGYDPILRRATGSYYTPVEAVDPIVNLVDQLLVRRLNCQRGFASPGVTVIDPGVGTGTFLFRILDRIACAVRDDEGEGAVGPQLHQLAKHLIGFELQAGPYSVAEVRLASELVRRGVAPGTTPLRLFLTDTLADPNEPEHHLAAIYAPIAASRSKANEIKRHEPVMVVIGNPPYREHSRGRGGWVEYGDPGPVRERHALLADFIPPREWGLGAHVKHLYNPYVYFWRWATWKVFEGHPNDRGVVAFITVAGYLNGPGFAAMRAYLRRTADAVWIIDCSPEGYQPDVATRIFQGVQQPVCITIALRDGSTDPGTPAPVRYISVHGRREEKFAALGALDIDDEEWRPCPTDWRAPFLPLGDDTWTSYPTLEQLLGWSSPGVTAHRTWVMDPNKDVLAERSARLLEAESRDEKATLLKETRDSKLSTVRHPLPGFSAGAISLADDRAKALDPPIRYGWRSFDRQWILPDVRLIHDPRRPLWQIRNAPGQVYLTGLMAHSPSSGPALTATDLIPDLHHYRGSFGGRTWPLWLDSAGTRPNVVPGLLAHLDDRFEVEVTGEDLFSYIAAVLANPAYTSRFADDLLVPGLRVPLTADASLFAEASAIGRRVLWLHTYGQRFSDPATGRPPGPPRVPGIRRPQVIATIPDTEVGMPESVEYDAVEQVLSVGVGRIHPVEPAVWDYGVSGMKIVKRWFDRRKRQPDGRRSSPLDDIVALSWPPEWTSELLDLLHVLTLLVDLEPQLQDLLDRIVDNALISEADLHAADVLPVINRPEVEMPEQGLGRLF